MQDQFKDVKSADNTISQATYAEIISVTATTSPAINTYNNVYNSLPRLAFNKKLAVPEARFTIQPIDTAAGYNYSSSSQSVTPLKASPAQLNDILTQAQSYSANLLKQNEIITCSLFAGDRCSPQTTTCLLDVAFVIDDSGSMGPFIQSLANGLSEIGNLFLQVSQDYRMSLYTFKDCDRLMNPNNPWIVKPFACNNFSDIIVALNNIQPFGGQGDEPSDYAIYKAMVGTGVPETSWRQNATKIIFMVTDEPPGGCPEDMPYPSAWNYEKRLAYMYEIANAAANCGIKFVIVSVWSSDLLRVDDKYQKSDFIFREGARITNGFYANDPGAFNIAKLLTSYILGVCSSDTVSITPECSPRQNKIINGNFETGIEGWVTTPTVAWNIAEKNMMIQGFSQIGSNFTPASATQTITGLTPGRFATFSFSVKGVKNDRIVYGIISTEGIPGTPEFENYSQDNVITLGDNNRYQKAFIRAYIPSSGEITVYVKTAGQTNWGEGDVINPIYIDDVYVCELLSADCASGSSNIILNPDFIGGVDNWEGEFGPLLPANDPQYWDSILQCAKLSLDGTLILKQSVDVDFDSNLILTFVLQDNRPNTIGDLGIRYRVYSGSTVYIDKVLYNRDVTEFPITITESFTHSSLASSTVWVEFATGSKISSGDLSGLALIKAVSLCSANPVCEQETLDFSNFDTNAQGWEGYYDQRAMRVEADQSGFPPFGLISTRVKKTYTDIPPNTTVTLNYFYTPGRPGLRSFYYMETTNRIVKGYIEDGPPSILVQAAPGNNGLGTLFVAIYLDVNQPGVIKGDYILVDNILLCSTPPVACPGAVNNLTVRFNWLTMPKYPVNLFGAAVEFTTRDYQNPDNRTTLLKIPRRDFATTNLGPGSCDSWAKDNSLLSFPININMIPGNTYNISSNQTSYAYATPGALSDSKFSTNRSSYLFEFKEDPTANIERNIESITVRFLANRILPTNEITFTPPLDEYLCQSDLDALNVTISYNKADGTLKSFSQIVLLSSLYTEQLKVEPNPLGWGPGSKGQNARIEEVLFSIDDLLGRGLDQCSTPIAPPIITGSGSIVFDKMSLKGRATMLDPCDAEVIITSLSEGGNTNETQSIALPNPTGGTWALTVIASGKSHTATVSGTVTAEELQQAISNLPHIGFGNVLVTGIGTAEDPFIVEFTGILSGLNLPLMTADGSNLLGAASGVVSTIISGSKNEVQAVFQRDIFIVSGFELTFDGESTQPLASNSPIRFVESALAALPNIGKGNVSVTGTIEDRDVIYRGPWRVEFIGKLANTNVPMMTVRPGSNTPINPPYTVSLIVQGGPGVKDTQRVTIYATGGTFKLTVYDPNNPTEFYTTTDLAYNAEPDVVQAAIADAPFFELADVSVRIDNNFTDGRRYIVTFGGAYSGIDVPQMDIDTSNLLGGTITVTPITDGVFGAERQRIQIVRAKGGSFRLVITVNGLTEITDFIPWNTTAQGLKEDIATHTRLQLSDIIVVQETPTNAEVVAQFVVTLLNVGNVPLMDSLFQETLLCNTIVFDPVPEPPYEYPLIPACDIEVPSCGINDCLPGPLLTRPCDGDSPLPIEPCCDPIRESANISKRYVYQRDLLLPIINNEPMTVRMMARAKNLDITKYTPYLRNYQNNALTQIDYNTKVYYGMSIVYIDNSIDTSGGRREISKHLSSKQEILPSRMIWPSGRLLPVQ
jgi:hypothetical protein